MSVASKCAAWVLLAPAVAVAAAQSSPLPVHHPIATHSPAAQAAFDRGLALVYAFNFQAAERTFREAAADDPSAAMPYWGLALAEGPNYNALQPSLAEAQAASDALEKARERAARLPPGVLVGAGPSAPAARVPREAAEERAYIEALAMRFSCAPHPNCPQLESAYDRAMGALSASHPGDPDAATLYAEGLMEQRAWNLWDPNGQPGPDTQTILSVLEGVLRRWPAHLGANHLYIHAAEASSDPARALASARRLDALAASGGFAGDGHLLHMPAHLYIRTGDFAAAERATLAAAASDRAYVRAHPGDVSYHLGYALHNLSFLVAAASMDGDYPAALSAAQELAAGAATAAAGQPAATSDQLAPLRVWVRFGRWSDILSASLPPDPSPGTMMFWHYARASAWIGQGQLAQALAEERAVRAALHTPQPGIGSPPLSKPVVHDLIIFPLNARLAAARGNFAFAIEQWQQAVAAEDSIAYREPPAWYPVRESLGAVLLRAGQPSQAEAVFRECLKRIPNDPRALFGLWQALVAQHRDAEAGAAHRQFLATWKGGDLRLEDL